MITRRWWISFPFVLALAVLVFLVWGFYLAVNYPHDGITAFTLDGVIDELDPESPTSQVLRVGDKIIAIDGVPYHVNQQFYSQKHVGEIVIMMIDRGGQLFNAVITLQSPHGNELMSRLAPLFVALLFWGIGLVIQAYHPAQESTSIFVVFFVTAAGFLVSGVASAFIPSWTSLLTRFLIWIIGPLAVHLHFYFPQVTRIRYRGVFVYGLYALGIGCGLIYAFGPQSVDSPLSYANQFQLANRIFLAITLLLVVGLLLYTYQETTSAGVRSKIRIVVLGGALTFIPLVALFIIPDGLIGQSLIPYSYLFFFLGILPLTYGYAIFRYRLIEIEKHINRGATYILVYSILVLFYLVFYYILDRSLPGLANKIPIINTILILALSTIFIPLHRLIQRVVDTVFYGGWYDYRSAVSQITHGLEQITESQVLADTISERLVDTLRLEDVCVFLSDVSGDFSTISVAPIPIRSGSHPPPVAPLPRSSLTYLLNMGGVVERNVLREALNGTSLSSQELTLLESEQVHLWVPIIGHGNVLGLLALGPKFGGDIFSGEDMDILRVVARHLAPLIENIHLVSRLKGYAAELELRVAMRTEELSTAKKRVEAILASVGEGVIVADLDDNLLLMNQMYLQQSGYSEVELIGQKIWNCFQSERLEELKEEIQSHVMAGDVWSGELLAFRKGGSQYNVQLTIAPLRNENGDITGYVGSQRDITQQKELDRLKDLFVSDVSHELRTPTTNIGLYLDLLSSASEEKRVYYIRVLKEQSRLLVKLVEDILDLSRLAKSKDRGYEFDLINLNFIADQVVAANRLQAESSGLILEFESDQNLQPMMGEPSQISRLVSNLVSNAIHYTESGKIGVRTFMQGSEVCLLVEDTGIGIDPEDMPHLFERFYRGRRVRQSSIHGTGLGLAIVKEIADIHMGKIDIRSDVGQGTRFTVRFPVAVDELWLVR